MTNLIRWSTQGGGFYLNNQSKVDVVLLELYATKSLTWNLHVDK